MGVLRASARTVPNLAGWSHQMVTAQSCFVQDRDPVRTAAPAHASPPTRLWRMLRVGAAAVQVMEEPSMWLDRGLVAGHVFLKISCSWFHIVH